MSKIHDILKSKGNKLWHVRLPDGSRFGPADEPTLREWAKAGSIQPDHDVSVDEKNWQRADALPSLANFWAARREAGAIPQAVAEVDLSAPSLTPEDLQGKLDDTKAEHAADRNDLSTQEAKLQAAVDTATKELAARNTELQEVRDEAAKVQAEAKAEENALRERIQELEGQVAPGNVADESRRAVAELQETREGLTLARRELKKAEKQNVKLADELKAKQSELKKVAKAAERERARQEKALAKLEEDKAELLDSASSTEADLSKRIDTLAKQAPDMAALEQTRATVEELRDAHNELEIARQQLADFKAGKRSDLTDIQKRERDLAKKAAADQKQLAKTEAALEALKEEHAELRDINKKTLAQLRSKVDRLRDRKPSAAELRESKETVAEFQDARAELADTRERATALRREIREGTSLYKRERKTLDKELLTRQATLESSQLALEELDDLIAEEKAETKKALKPLERKVSKLIEKTSKKPAKNATAAVLARFEKAKEDLTNARAELKTEKDAAKDAASELREQRAELAEGAKTDSAQMRESKQAIKDLDRTYKADTGALEKELKATDREIARLEKDTPTAGELKSSKASLARQEKIEADLAEAREHLKAETDKSKQTISELQAELASLKTIASESEAALAAERKAINTLRKEYEGHKHSASKTEEELKATVDALRSEAPTPAQLRAKEKKVDKLETSKANLSDAHAELESLKTSTSEQLAKLEEKRAEAEEKAAQADATREAGAKALDELKAENEKLKTDRKTLESSLRDQIATLEKKIEEAPDARKARAAVLKVEALEDELAQTKATLAQVSDDAESRVAELSSTEKALESGTEEVEGTLATDTLALQRLQKRYQALERRSERIETKLREQIQHLQENAASSSDMLESAFEAMQDHSTLGSDDAPLAVTLEPRSDEPAIDSLKEKLEVAEEKAAYLETRLGKDADEHNAEISRLKREIEELNAKAETLENERVEYKRVEAQKKGLEATLAKAEAERVQTLKAARDEADKLKEEHESLIRDVKENEAKIRKQMEDDHSSATRAHTEQFDTQIHSLRTQLDNSEEQLLSLNHAVQDERRQRLRAAKLTSDAHGAFSEQFEKVRQQAENAASIIETNQRAMNTRNAELESQITTLNDRMLSMQQSHQDEQSSLEEKLADQKRYYEQRLQRSIDRQEQLMKLLENMQSAMIQV